MSLPNLKAISGEIPRFSARIRCSICRETRIPRAAAATDIPIAGSTSSRSNSPGCIGGIFGSPFTRYSRAMVDFHFNDIDRGLPATHRPQPTRRYAERSVHVNAIAVRLSAQRVEIEARYLELRSGCDGVERSQPTPHAHHQIRTHRPSVIVAPEPGQSLVPEAPYHDEILGYAFTPVSPGLTRPSCAFQPTRSPRLECQPAVALPSRASSCSAG